MSRQSRAARPQIDQRWCATDASDLRLARHPGTARCPMTADGSPAPRGAQNRYQLAEFA